MGIGFMKKKDKESSQEKNLKERQNESDQANTKKIKSKNKKTVNEKFKEFGENVKGAVKDVIQIKRRSIIFELACRDLMNSDTFKQMYPSGFDPYKKVHVTPGIIRFVYGKNGFLQQLVKLHYGKSYDYAIKLRGEYDKLKLDNVVQELSTLTEAQNKDVLDSLNEVGTTFEELSNDIREFLAPEASGLFANVAMATAGITAIAGAGATAVGSALCSVAKHFVDYEGEEFITLIDDYGGYMYASGEALNWWWGPSMLACGSVTLWVGLAVTAAVALAVAIKKAYDKYKAYVKHKKDMELLEKIEKAVSKLKKSLTALNPSFDKYGAINGSLEKLLEKGNAAADQYLTDKKKKKEKKGQEKEEKKKSQKRDEENIDDITESMDSYKIKIFRMLSQLVVADREKFAKQVEAETRAKADEMASQYLPLVSGTESAEDNKKDEIELNNKKESDKVSQNKNSETDSDRDTNIDTSMNN